MNESHWLSTKTPIVIFGGGFLGGHLAAQLKRDGHEVIIQDRGSCDLLDPLQVREAMQDVPYGASVYISAAITRLRSNDQYVFDQNYRIVQHILNVLPFHVSHIIFFSSIDVYGSNPVLPVLENTAIEPNDHYAMSKLVGEFLVRREAESRGIGWTIFRLAGIYGPGDEGKSTINRMTTAALNSGQILLTGNPLVERDFVWVQDVALLAGRAIREGIIGDFNVATGHSHTIHTIAATLAAIVGPEVSVLQLDASGEKRASCLRFEVAKLNNAFTGLNMTTLEEGLTEYVSYLRAVIG